MGTARAGVLTIPNGANVSNAILAREGYDDAIDGVMLHGVDTVDGVITYTIEVSPNPEDTAGVVWNTLQTGSPPADTVPPLVGKSRVLTELQHALALRIKSSGPVTAPRIWRVSKYYPPD